MHFGHGMGFDAAPAALAALAECLLHQIAHSVEVYRAAPASCIR